MRSLVFLLLLTLSVSVFAQDGFIRGTVNDEATGEPLFAVTVVIKGTTNGAVTDFEGKFSIKTAPGVYDVQVSFVSFLPLTITGLIVKPGEVTLIESIILKESVEELEAVVITAEVVRTTEAALLTVKRKSANLLDGISSASFRKIGDSDAASASKRITGVSIEGGKYVYVRGLGDRYTKTLLNGMDIPGLDPDRNTLQMDIFPTNVLSNIIVSKTFTADLPADFTGGLVNIETQDVPDTKTTTAQVGIGFNPRMHFNSDYLTYEGGKTDWLGFDDGTRKLHIPDNEVTNVQNAYILNPNSPDGLEYKRQLDGFNKQLGPKNQRSFMNYNLGFATGDQKSISIGTLGYNFSMTYKTDTEFYDDAIFARYASLPTRPELVLFEERLGAYSTENVLLGGLAGLALKRSKSKHKLNLLKLQSGESKAGFFNSETTSDSPNSDLIGIETNLEYSQKSLTNLLLSGEYFLNPWTLEWKVSSTVSSILDPDIRFTKYEVLPNNGGFDIGTGNSGLPQRIWRELDEVNVASRFDAKRSYQFSGSDAFIKFGIGATVKQRDFIIREFNIDVNQQGFVGDFDELMDEENLWPNSNANFHVAQYVGGNVNQYDASSSNYSFYVSNQFNPFERLKTIIGLRGEIYTQIYSGTNQTGITLDNEKVIDEFNLFPTGNFIYSLSDDQNLRLAYTRTIARYSFKEASFIEYYDPLTGRTFLGGLSPIQDVDGNAIWDGNIESTLINNFDLRWEKFGKRAQILSISAFYKLFNDPIEVVQISGADNNFQPQNVGDATVYGAELEFRQGLEPILPALRDLFINGNATFTVSEITMTEQEFEARQRNARTNESVENTRELQGQAPYIINAGLSYASEKNKLEVGFYYNVQGSTLTYTGGVNAIPDVYSVPFHSLNLTANKTFGVDDKMRLSLKVNNILNDRNEWEFQSFGVENRPLEARSPGTAISLSFRYAFN